MPNRIRFHGVVLREFKRKLECAGMAKFSATLNQSTCSAMDWCDIPECMTDVSLTGEIAGITAFELVPTDAKLKRHGFTLAVLLIDGFEAVRVGKSGVELRFTAHFTDAAAAAKLEAYMLTVGDARGALTVAYAEQDSLPIVDEGPFATEEQRLAVLED